MSLELFAFSALFVAATLLVRAFFAPRIHWGTTVVSALLAASLLLALQYWLVSLGLLAFDPLHSSGFLLNGVPAEMTLACISAPLFFAVLWQAAKEAGR
jgi:uncharacterized membrane protein YhdT